MPILIRSWPRLLFAAAVLALPHPFLAQAIDKPLPLHAALQDKDFYLLSLLQEDPRVRTALMADKSLDLISAERQHFLAWSLKTCKGDAACTLKSLLWTEEEIRMVSFALEQLYQEDSSLRELVDKSL